jgi:phage shock protein A
MATNNPSRTADVQSLILERLTAIDKKLEDLVADMHSGARRMDSMARDIEVLDASDTRQASQIDALEHKVAELEPVIEMTKNLKKLLYAAAAVVIALQFLPQIIQQIKLK